MRDVKEKLYPSSNNDENKKGIIIYYLNFREKNFE